MRHPIHFRTILLSMLMLFSASSFALSLGRETVWVPHLPEANGWMANIVFENRQPEPREIGLSFYSIESRYLGSTRLTLAPVSRRVMNPSDLSELVESSEYTVSYFEVYASSSQENPVSSLAGIQVGVEYGFGSNPEETTMVEGIRQPARQWRITAGNWSKVFDGVAVIFTDYCLNGKIYLNHYARRGELLGQQVIEAGANKQLLNLGSMFEARPGSYIDISADYHLAVVGLRGALDGSWLLGNTAVAQTDFIEQRLELEKNRNRWNTAGFTSYSFTYQNICFCIPEVTREVRLQVEENWIRSYRYSDDDTEVAVTWYRNYRTIPDLFTLIEEAFAEAASVSVSYDETYGFPTNVTIDWDACTIDEESYITVGNLEPAAN